MSCSCTFWSDDDVGVSYLPAFHTVLDAMHHEGQREFSLLREVPDKMECLACRCTFTNREDQVFSSFVSKSFINVRRRRGRCHLSLSLVSGGTLQARLASFQFETKDVGNDTSDSRRV